jgi:Flp pilus assembly protein TadG
MLKRQGKAGRRERGVVIISLALFMLVLIGFGSLSVDVAKLTNTRTQLQNAADAAALAGASAVDPATGIIQPALALARAQTAAAANKAFIKGPTPVVLAAADVTFPTPNRIRVKVRREGANGMVTTLAQVLGITKLDVTATATAKVDTTGTAMCGIVPLGVALPGNQTFQVGCANTYSLKVGAGGGVGGQYGALNFPSCTNSGACAGMPPTGANTYRCLMANGYCCPISVGDVLNTESGNMSGPTRQAIDDRFDNDTVRDLGICYSEYLTRGGNGQRVVLVPITTPVWGQPRVTVLGFSAFFLKTRVGNGQGSTILGEFLYQVVVGTGGTSSGGAVAFTIRLVPNS